MNLDPLYTLIRKYEGLRLKAYRCPAGVLTIGYGTTGKDITPGLKITAEEAEARMKRDALVYAVGAKKLSPALQNLRLCAIADFCYNLGLSRYKTSTLRRRVNAGDWEGAKEELQKWVWGGGRKLPGLILRRQAESSLL